MNPPLNLSPKRMAFLASTLLLTATGFTCRVLGFFYRIFLSRTIGAEGLGVYQMMHPVFGICFGLCAGSIQTALSQYIAANTQKSRRIFHTGLLISMGISLTLAGLICRFSTFLAEAVLLAPSCAGYLPLIAVSVPFAALHACINGYYYGMQRSRVPAFSQVAEQVLRMTLVFLIASSWMARGREITVLLAVLGHLLGEIASAAFTLICLFLIPPKPAEGSASAPSFGSNPGSASAPGSGADARALMGLALPLMASRLVLNLLSSAEAVWLPSCLQATGMSGAEAFSVYGVLTGMAMPFILFPSAITNSMAVLLLPSVAEAQAQGQERSISSYIALSLRYSLYMGILCIGVFVLFGGALGASVFHEPEAGRFIQILAWLCPFLYLSTTLGSILNGLGLTRTTFLQNTSALLLRISFVLLFVPRFGITAYLWGMLASELFLALLHLWSLSRRVPILWNAWDMIAKPAAFLLAAVGIHFFFCGLVPVIGWLPPFLDTAVRILHFAAWYGGLLLAYHLARPHRAGAGGAG